MYWTRLDFTDLLSPMHTTSSYPPICSGHDAAESGEGDVDGVHAPPLPCVASCHQVLRLLPVGHVLVHTLACSEMDTRA